MKDALQLITFNKRCNTTNLHKERLVEVARFLTYSYISENKIQKTVAYRGAPKSC